MTYDHSNTITRSCACCHSCKWPMALGEGGAPIGHVCLSGGPYDGYIMRDGTVITVDARGPDG